MKIVIGYSRTFHTDYSPLKQDMKIDDPVSNLLLIDHFNNDYMYKILGTPVEDTSWETQSGMDLDHSSNTLRVHLASITEPNYYDTDTIAINYGTIGALIGLTMSHAFNEKGREFDAAGNKLNAPWVPAGEDKLIKLVKAKLMVQYASLANKLNVANKALPYQYKISPITVEGDIADNLGLSMAYRAYQNLNLPPRGMNRMDARKLFYYGWEHVLREYGCDPAYYSIDAIRGNGPVRNNPAFYQAFPEIKSGDPMYLQPDEQLHLDDKKKTSYFEMIP